MHVRVVFLVGGLTFTVPALAGCSSESQSSSSSWGGGTALAGTWSCDFTQDWGGVTEYPGETLTTEYASSFLAAYAIDPWDIAWFDCGVMDVQGNAAQLMGPGACSQSIERLLLADLEISASSDGQTLDVYATGTRDGMPAQLSGSCTRTGPPPSSSSSSGGGSGSGGGSSGGRQPECRTDSECGDCAQCSEGTCYVCPVGSQGICTC
jgi:hypothetical protein